MELESKIEQYQESGASSQNSEGRSQNPASREEDGSERQEVSWDLPPEFCQYRDEGCELAESCLNCPFARCIYDEPGGKRRWMKRWRAREIVRLHIIEGREVKELAKMFGVNERTVQRDLRAAKENPQCHSEGVLRRKDA